MIFSNIKNWDSQLSRESYLKINKDYVIFGNSDVQHLRNNLWDTLNNNGHIFFLKHFICFYFKCLLIISLMDHYIYQILIGEHFMCFHLKCLLIIFLLDHLEVVSKELKLVAPRWIRESFRGCSVKYTMPNWHTLGIMVVTQFNHIMAFFWMKGSFLRGEVNKIDEKSKAFCNIHFIYKWNCKNSRCYKKLQLLLDQSKLAVLLILCFRAKNSFLSNSTKKIALASVYSM